MRLQLAVQFVKNDPRLDKTPPAFDIKFENPIHMLAGIDDQRVVDRLPTLRCAAAARQNGNTLLSRKIQSRLDIGQRFGHDNRMRHHLID